ncbi:MAG: LptA/OstA family protein [Alphaproteobacteria bacterium]
MIRILTCTCFILLYATNTYAQTLTGTPAPSNSNEPLEITADTTLEWLRNEQKFIARGNALAVQGTSAVAAQTLTADYIDTPKNGMQISIVTAERDVIITSQDSKAYGDKAIHDMTKGIATITGSNLRMISPDQTVTARDKFEYFVEQGRLNAIGNARATRPNKSGGNDTITADTLSAVFTQNAKGQRVLKTLEAKGNVIIITPTEEATGDYAIYRATTDKAELKGDVEITRGPNILKGERAEIDLKTNKSTIFAPQTQNGRVRGVFFPGSEKNE